MEVVGLLSGGAPVIKKYQINATVADRGVPLLIGTSNEAGLDLPTTTAAADVVGVNLDTATYTTTQGSGESSAERLVSVVINPDAILEAKMSGGATENTALTLWTVTTASSGGTAVTAGDFSTTSLDEGIIWAYSGANVGGGGQKATAAQKNHAHRGGRKITSVSSTAATVTVPFDYGINVGDTFLAAPYWPMQTQTVQLTTNFYQADASIVVGTGAGFNVIGLKLRDISDNGRSNSFVQVIARGHWLNYTS